jgi:hypothetical protein
MLLADGNAVTAPDAPVSMQHEFFLGGDRFGIVAPHAVKRASFQKNRRADARSVIHREALDIEDGACHESQIIDKFEA